MSNQLDIRPDAMRLSDPVQLAAFFNGYLDQALDIFEHCDEADEVTTMLSGHALSLRSVFTQKLPMVIVDEADFGHLLGHRLKNSLCADGLVEKSSPVMLSSNPEDFIYLAAMRMVQDFVDLIKDSSDKEESSDVFDLRRTAFVADWVNRFLGKDKYAR